MSGITVVSVTTVRISPSVEPRPFASGVGFLQKLGMPKAYVRNTSRVPIVDGYGVSAFVSQLMFSTCDDDESKDVIIDGGIHLVTPPNLVVFREQDDALSEYESG